MDPENPLQALKTARAEFEKLVGEIRPELHRYCARMTGSVVDGEDVVQETLAKAFYLLPQTSEISNLRSWIFRIAHNKAIDYTRRYDRRFGESLDDHADLAADSQPLEAREMAKIGLSLFMKLTPAQRGAVILKDVLGHSLLEIGEILDTSVPSVKGALNRGRAALHKLGRITVDAAPPPLDASEISLLERYVTHFVAQDFDSLRALLAQDVRLDVVGIVQSRGDVQVGGYFHRYSGLSDWSLQVGSVEGRPAILVFNPQAPAVPTYFILIDWVDGRVARIRDYRYARYVIADAAVAMPEP
jgi:RNA polymerase sigma-70 factor (ECF subfamily)